MFRFLKEIRKIEFYKQKISGLERELSEKRSRVEALEKRLNDRFVEQAQMSRASKALIEISNSMKKASFAGQSIEEREWIYLNIFSYSGDFEATFHSNKQDAIQELIADGSEQGENMPINYIESIRWCAGKDAQVVDLTDDVLEAVQWGKDLKEHEEIEKQFLRIR